MINLFEYQNFREYLKAYYLEQKAIRKSFSYRSLSESADLSAPSFVYHVIEGKRNLTKNSIMKISRALGHNRQECDYFENLVFFNQAQTVTEKTYYYSRILEIRKPFDVKVVDEEKYEFYSRWYHSVIREVITFFDFRDDYSKLGAFLIPPITAKQARDSIKLLERLNFIKRDESGNYFQVNEHIEVKPSTPNAFMIEKFQMEMLETAIQAYNKLPVSERMSSSTTFSISKETFELFKIKTREFRRELAEIAGVDTSVNRVYQFTMNLFPVSRSKNE
ncbi:MAG TPA: TIGR02147 family protein [Chitinispirillaceae bacterium]|nr:TIGR02147 family protein [Chitinispirillaceae bacterium]